MSEETNVAPGGGESAPAPTVITPAADTPQTLTLSQAARALAAARNKPKESAPESADTATEQPQLADEASAAPEEAPGEVTTEAEPAEKPPIEPPRSWTKEAKERWSSLPPETQEYLAAREQERDREVRRSQNETADKLKGLTAKEQEVEQARKEYEAKLPAIMQALQDAQAGTFSDIRTMDDVTRIANEDPFRYLQWQAHQQKLQAVNHELETAKQRQAHEQKSKWADHVQKENELAAERNPELADPDKAKQLQTAAVELLHDKGFTQQELARLANGEDKLSIFDHRIQSLLLDGVKYQAAQKAPPKAIPKPVPSMQRPGVAPPKGAAASEAIQALTAKLERSGSLKDATALRAAQLKARA